MLLSRSVEDVYKALLIKSKSYFLTLEQLLEYWYGLC